MLATLSALVLTGIEAQRVTVEVDIQSGLPAFELSGLASASIKEARERVRSAIKNSGFEFPNRKIIVNLAPADMKKEGSHFDLAIAVGILIATGQMEQIPAKYYLAGELSLDGSLRKVPGVLSMAIELANSLEKCLFIVPEGNREEASLVDNVSCLSASNLREVKGYFAGEMSLTKITLSDIKSFTPDNIPDFSEVKGQESAKRALLIAAAGMHNVVMLGPPGGGKTMLARRFPGIFPEMNRSEILETTRIYSVANLLDTEQPLIINRPFRAPHKNASSASIIGGGKIPRPGEISLAQNGVLFLDEFPEFSRDVLEALRQPLEDKKVTIARTQATCTYPADFSLIAAMNSCPCGNFGSDRECHCTPIQIHRYLNRISGPLLDRMDLHVEVPRVDYDDLKNEAKGQNSREMRDKVTIARDLQQRRFAGKPLNLNSQMGPREIRKYCQLDHEAENLLRNAFQRLQMSARGYDRVLKVSRTIADLQGCKNIQISHLAEALQYRSLDRKYWRN